MRCPIPSATSTSFPNESREWKTDFALSNNFGFGGHTPAWSFRKFTD